MYLAIKNAKIEDAYEGSGFKFYVRHPSNDAVLGYFGTMQEAQEFVEYVNAYHNGIKPYTMTRRFYAVVGAIVLVIIAVAVIGFVVWGNQYLTFHGF
jgi:hypothetical protein